MTDAPDYDAIEAQQAIDRGQGILNTLEITAARRISGAYPDGTYAHAISELIIELKGATAAIRELEAKVAGIREVTINTLAADTDPVADGMALLRIRNILDSKDPT